MSSSGVSASPPVVVIGAGVSGLATVKACVEEGLRVVCYEKTDSIGGLWRFRERCSEGTASVMKTTIINTSKEMTAFSDFPAPDHFPNFMHNKYFVSYLEMYAAHFDLLKHIRLEHLICKVDKHEEHQQSGYWNVTIRNMSTGVEFVQLATAVVVCVGHHSFPNAPHFPGLRDTFRGRVVHSHACTSVSAFHDERVLVVGMGNSGGDVAVQLSHVAEKVYLSSRRGSWVMPRLGDGGQPIDLQYGRRFIADLLNLFPDWLKNLHAEYKLNCRYDHRAYDLEPRHHFYSQHPMVNDDLPGRLLSGSIELRDDVARFTLNGVVFHRDHGAAGEEERVTPIDAVVLATGYDIRFPFLQPSVLDTRQNRVDLYKYVFPTDDGGGARPGTLSFVGLIQPFGPLPPIAELQARWVARVLAGHATLPSPAVRQAEVLDTRLRHQKRYVASARHTIEVDCIPYMEEIARLAGVQPRLSTLALTDPALWVACYLGPAVPYQYRLHGPHSAPDQARRHILSVGQRVAKPMKTRLPSGHAAGVDCCTMFGSKLRRALLYMVIVLAAALLLSSFV